MLRAAAKFFKSAVFRRLLSKLIFFCLSAYRRVCLSVSQQFVKSAKLHGRRTLSLPLPLPPSLSLSVSPVHKQTRARAHAHFAPNGIKCK